MALPRACRSEVHPRVHAHGARRVGTDLSSYTEGRAREKQKKKKEKENETKKKKKKNGHRQANNSQPPTAS